MGPTGMNLHGTYRYDLTELLFGEVSSNLAPLFTFWTSQRKGSYKIPSVYMSVCLYVCLSVTAAQP